MSLSISNSKKAIIYTMIATTMLMLPAVALVNHFIRFAENNAGDVFGVQRIRSTLNALPIIAESTKETVLVFGSSLVKDGFSPRYFDETVNRNTTLDIQSFNIGLGNMNPAYQKLLAKRIKETLAQHDKRLSVSLIEFNPFLATKKREQFRPFLKEQVTALLMSDAELLKLAEDDIELFARMAATKYLRNGVSAEAITGGLKTIIDSAQSQAPLAAQFDDEYLQVLAERKALYRKLSQAINKAQPTTKKSHIWNPNTQGGLIDMIDLPIEDHELVSSLTQNMQYPKTLQFDLQSRINCCDILELGFSDSLLSDFESVIEEFQSFSDKVEVVLMPRNKDIVKPSPKTEEKLNQLLANISEKLGIKIRNYQTHPKFDATMFYDATHLSMDKGRLAFSELLANDLSQSMVQLAEKQTGTPIIAKAMQ
ncbi:MAG: hypothetical protein MI867_07340 [Pseudomonadales bacterium]|nr:hypothetical protein [Pseudomonadales bacterium]